MMAVPTVPSWSAVRRSTIAAWPTISRGSMTGLAPGSPSAILLRLPRPESEVAAGRMTDDGHTVEVEAFDAFQPGESVDGGGYVAQGARVAAAAVADAAVLDVPGGVAAVVQIAAKGPHQVEAVSMVPEAAVDEYDNRGRGFTGGDG